MTAADLSRFRIDGMDCASCAAKIETAARRVSGVEEVTVSLAAGTMAVRHGPAADLDEVQRRVVSLGYAIRPAVPGAAITPPARPADAAHEHDHAGHHHGDHDHAGHDHGHGNRPEATTATPDRDDHGPELHGHFHDHSDEGGPFWATRRFLLTAAAGVAFGIAFLVTQLAPSLGHWPFAVAMLAGLVPIARRAFAAARYGTPFSIEMLMTIAAIGAVAIGASEEAAVVVFLFLVGELLEGVAAGRARSSIKALADLVPKTALIESDGRTMEVAADSVAIGTIVIVRPGDRIAADGLVVSGESAVNEAPVTGESMPVPKRIDQAVFAGTINGDGLLRIRTTASAADNTIARVVRLVEEAQESKAPTERFIDRFSRIYTPGVLAFGALVALVPPLLFGGLWSEWVYKGLAILLIGCPCALVISTPAAIAAGLAAGARRGLLMKGGAVLEAVGRLTVIAFDKTGTLTMGRPQVTRVIAYGHAERDVVAMAAALETGSSHPLARAILDHAGGLGIVAPAPLDAGAIPGQGVEGTVGSVRMFLGSAKAAAARAGLSSEQEAEILRLNDNGETVSVLLANGMVAGLIAIRDEPRPDARAALAELRAAGIRTVMLTGDNQRTATAIGRALGIPVQGELLPADKMRVVEALRAGGDRVGQVGDGINDAPALAAADVGIAMGGGTDVALETADAAALHNRMRDIPAMVRLSRSAMSNIGQNIVIALGLKAVFLVTTLIGVTGLWPAILADTGATVLVTINAMRLLRWRAD